MQKSALERIIYQKAETEARQSLQDLKELLFKNPFGTLLTLKIGDKEMPLVCNHSGGLFSSTENMKLHTNLDEVFNKVTEQFVSKKTDELMSKLDNLRYLFEENQ